MADFLSFTLQKPQIQQQQGANGVDKAKQNQQTQQSKQAQQNDQLKKTDVFTAAKNGMQAQNQQQNMLAGGDSGFGGVNAFGDSGFGDTVSFSTKATDTVDTNSSKTAAKTASVASKSNDNSDIAQIAKEIGVEANESAVKNKLASMSSEELANVDKDAVQKAKELGFVSEAQTENKQDNNQASEKIQNNKEKTDAVSDSKSAGTFSGQTVSATNFANNDAELKQIAEELGIEADENTIKNKLTSMDPKDLVKLSSDTLDNAADMGLISMSDIEKKIGKNDSSKNSQKGDEDPSKKIKFGTFTAGSEV